MSEPIIHHMLPTSATNWEHLRAKTDEEIARDIATDPDADINDYIKCELPSGEKITYITIEPSAASWLESHQLDGGKLASTLLAQFVAAQSGSNNA